MHLFTIGVYGSTADEFFKKLTDNRIDTFCDVRHRRAVRGSQYAFANSQRLQDRLEQQGIKYLHFPELAPSQEMIKMQDEADHEHHIRRRDRAELSPEFVKEYKKQCLHNFDAGEFIEKLGSDAKNVVLFCVEKTPEACHRTLLAEKISSGKKLKVTHL
ncbi:MAG TPA: DUF488 domain-containing protein [Bacteroidia bacterium]|nr:DUF488 domain-containing protein [Bacteroidia bacterium]